MADLVNTTHRERLSPKNSEPSHLKGGSYETLGGPTWDHKGGPDAYKINASAGVGTDTTIPKAVGAEPSHLNTGGDPVKSEDATDSVDVEFDGDTDDFGEVDDLDRELDEFEETDPLDIDIEVGDEDEDDPLKEEDENPFAKKDDDDEEEVKEGLENFGDKKAKPFTEEDENPFAKKDDDDEEDVKEEVGGEPSNLITKGEPVGKGEVSEEDENPFAKKDDDDEDEKEVKAESVKIRIKLPNTKLFESANMSAKTQKKVGVVFEQAIRATTKQVAAQLHAHYKKLTESKLARRDAIMSKQVDSYLSYVTEEWLRSNQITVRQSLRSQLAEEFLDGLKQLFKEHYIDVPDSKVNVVAKLSEDVRKLRKALNEEHGSKLKLRRLAEAANKARIVSESSRGLSEAQTARLQKLAGNTQYASAKDFREKIGLLKESYFPKTQRDLKRLPEDDVQEAVKQTPSRASDDADVNAIAQSLSRQANASKW